MKTLYCIFTARSKLRKVLFLALSVTFLVSLFLNQISREPLNRFCAKFTRNTCLVPRSNEYECQGRCACQGQYCRYPATKGEKSKVKVTKDKERAVHSHHPLPGSDGMVRSAAWRIVTRSLQTTSLSSRRDYSVAAGDDFGGLRAIYVWWNIFSSSIFCC